MSITDSDTYEYKYAINNAGNCTAATYSAFRSRSIAITDTLGADGVIRICVIGRDQVGNEQTTATTVAWTKDSTVPAANALTLSGTPASPDKTTTLNVTVNGSDIAYYRYKMGPAASTSCTSATGYNSEIARATAIVDNISSLADGSLKLCAYGRDAAGNYQSVADAITFTWTKDTTAPVATNLSLVTVPTNPSQVIALSIAVSGDGSSHYKYKVGVAASTDCSSASNYSAETAVSVSILDNISSISDGSVQLCVITRDIAGNWMVESAARSYTWFKDAHDPITGSSGAITVSALNLTSLTLNWTRATDVDNATPQPSLRYKVYKSAINNIDTPANMDSCESGGTCTVLSAFIADIATLDVMSLSSNTQYYFNVRVRDNIGRESAYSVLGQRTPPAAHIVYKDATNGRIKHAYMTTSVNSFASENAETTGVDAMALAIDSNKKAHIAYRTGTDLRYLTNGSGTWASALIDSGYAQSQTDIAMDSLGRPHVIFYRFDSNKDWKHTFYNGTAWLATPDRIWNGNGSAIKGHANALVIDSADKVHAVGYDASSFDLLYNTNEGGSWSNTNMIIPDGNGDVGSFTAVARDASNNIYVAYYDATNANLKFVKRTGTTWGTAVTLDSPGNVGQYPAIGVSPGGIIHIAYYDATNGDLKHVCYNGSAWGTPRTIDGSSADVGQYTSLAADLAGQAQISYYDATNGDLKYARLTCSGSATIMTIDSTGTVGLYSDIALEF